MRTEQERSRVRVERIMEAAADVFAEAGFAQTSMDAIAEASGTSKGGLYFHFPTKRVLFLALLERVAQLLQRRIAEAMAVEMSPSAKLDAAIRVMLRTFAHHRALARLFLIDAWGAGQEVHQRLLDIQNRFVALIGDQLRWAIADGVIAPVDVELVSAAWFGALLQIVARWLVTGYPADIETAAPVLRSLLLRSVALPLGEFEEETSGDGSCCGE